MTLLIIYSGTCLLYIIYNSLKPYVQARCVEETKLIHACNAGLCCPAVCKCVCVCAVCMHQALGGCLNIVCRSNDVVFVIVNAVIYMRQVVGRCC